MFMRQFEGSISESAPPGGKEGLKRSIAA
jgi:hypothetical protein